LSRSERAARRSSGRHSDIQPASAQRETSRAARSLRDKQDAYLAVRREVTRLLSEDRCDAAVKAALDGGYLALARETRDYCAAPTGGASSGTAASSNAQADQTSAN